MTSNNNNIFAKEINFNCNIRGYDIEAIVIEEEGKDAYLQRINIFNGPTMGCDVEDEEIIREYELQYETQQTSIDINERTNIVQALEDTIDKDKRVNHLLAKLTEECGQVNQIVGKSLNFGLDNYDPGCDREGDNLEKLILEMMDVIGTWELLCELLDEQPRYDKLIEGKKLKIKNWFEKTTGEEF